MKKEKKEQVVVVDDEELDTSKLSEETVEENADERDELEYTAEEQTDKTDELDKEDYDKGSHGPSYQGVVKVDRLNLRERDSKGSKILTVLNKGTVLSIINDTNPEWYGVEVPGRLTYIGFVIKSAIEV